MEWRKLFSQPHPIRGDELDDDNPEQPVRVLSGGEKP